MAGPRWLDEHEAYAWRTYQRMQAHLDAYVGRRLQMDSGLSTSDYAVLVSLSEAPEHRIRPFELSEALQWEKSRLSHHLTRMERRGLVTREGCPGDARGSFVRLTSLGRGTIEAAAGPHVATVRSAMIDALDPEQLEQLGAISARVLRRLADLAQSEAAAGEGEDGSDECPGRAEESPAG
jgi:DNA-binding MarR family transcriptional regulator